MRTIFAPRTVAENTHRINKAMGSRTWGEFRKMMPRDDYSELIGEMFDNQGKRRPRSSDDFDCDAVPGYSEGEYPRWLAPRMDEWVPVYMLRKYGTPTDSMVSDSFWDINEEDADKLAEELRARGFTVTHEPDLEFS
jgi:hypothetical protein